MSPTKSHSHHSVRLLVIIPFQPSCTIRQITPSLLPPSPACHRPVTVSVPVLFSRNNQRASLTHHNRQHQPPRTHEPFYTARSKPPKAKSISSIIVLSVSQLGSIACKEQRTSAASLRRHFSSKDSEQLLENALDAGAYQPLNPKPLDPKTFGSIALNPKSSTFGSITLNLSSIGAFRNALARSTRGCVSSLRPCWQGRWV